ncbi:unnamed protein product [Onchocerca flexuosa]|uniref:Uncharacterized protein n=1 Tax=Onchocerca flexuosa TaxID=387005 RepID=A0A183HE09_9BILA|nr:unnamed protein product [Onchocerca flexuosa]
MLLSLFFWSSFRRFDTIESERTGVLGQRGSW